MASNTIHLHASQGLTHSLPSADGSNLPLQAVQMEVPASLSALNSQRVQNFLSCHTQTYPDVPRCKHTDTRVHRHRCATGGKHVRWLGWGKRHSRVFPVGVAGSRCGQHRDRGLALARGRRTVQRHDPPVTELVPFSHTYGLVHDRSVPVAPPAVSPGYSAQSAAQVPAGVAYCLLLQRMQVLPRSSHVHLQGKRGIGGCQNMTQHGPHSSHRTAGTGAVAVARVTTHVWQNFLSMQVHLLPGLEPSRAFRFLQVNGLVHTRPNALAPEPAHQGHSENTKQRPRSCGEIVQQLWTWDAGIARNIATGDEQRTCRNGPLGAVLALDALSGLRMKVLVILAADADGDLGLDAAGVHALVAVFVLDVAVLAAAGLLRALVLSPGELCE